MEAKQELKLDEKLKSNEIKEVQSKQETSDTKSHISEEIQISPLSGNESKENDDNFSTNEDNIIETILKEATQGFDIEEDDRLRKGDKQKKTEGFSNIILNSPNSGFDGESNRKNVDHADENGNSIIASPIDKMIKYSDIDKIADREFSKEELLRLEMQNKLQNLENSKCVSQYHQQKELQSDQNNTEASQFNQDKANPSHHVQNKAKQEHIMPDDFESEGIQKVNILCSNCEEDDASISCLECDDVYCLTCDPVLHRNRKKRLHKRIPLEGAKSLHKRKLEEETESSTNLLNLSKRQKKIVTDDKIDTASESGEQFY